MTLDEAAAILGAKHTGEPQKVGLVNHFLDQVKQGMDGLKALGHGEFRLEHAESPAPLVWPKMLYKGKVEQCVVHSSDEEAEAYLNGFRPLVT